MDENQRNWISWARTLQRWGIKDGVAALIEVTGSLNVLLAQMLYISQPLFYGTMSSHSLLAIAQVLEDPADRQKFISFLREAPTSGPII